MPLRVVGCFLHEGKFLLLKRPLHKPEDGKWGLPAGKADPGEDDLSAMVRETEEETGYKTSKQDLEFLGSGIWDFPGYSVEFLTYRASLPVFPDITINSEEHDDYWWVSRAQCADLPLVHGVDDLLRYV